MGARTLLLLCLAALAAGCQGSPAPPPSAATAAAPAEDFRQAVARKDWSAAAPLLRDAIGRDPANVGLHYQLAVCATYLDAREEAVREFQWVIQHAPADSAEAQASLSWLADQDVAEPAPSESTTPGGPTPETRAADAGFAGRVLWSDTGEAPTPRSQVLVHLVGAWDGAAGDHRHRQRTDGEGRFQFGRLAPGPYQVTARIDGQQQWRLRVQVQPGRTVQLDLSPANSVKVRDDFPIGGG